jgi:RNA polymerase sigma-70 factor, ECF subfamily
MTEEGAAVQPLPSDRVADTDGLGDADLARLARQGEAGAFRTIMRRYNRRLYRAARGVLRDDSEAEDAVQEAYLRAFTGISEFRGEASLSTWLTRITLNEALGRLRRRRPSVDLESLDAARSRSAAQVIPFPLATADTDPERTAARRQIRQLLEQAIDGLPEAFRLVFVLRDLEEMSVEDTAAHLGLRPETVKTRLFRARRLLRRALSEQLASAVTDAFPFAGARCARITDEVLRRLGNPAPLPRGDQGGG